MNFKLTGALLNEAIRLHKIGLTLTEIGQRLGVSPDNLSKKLRPLGVDTKQGRHKPSVNRINLPSKVKSLYLSGASVLSLSKLFRVDRTAIYGNLKRLGVTDFRGGSEANYIRMGRMTKAETKTLTNACHAATKGKKRKESVLETASQSRQKMKSAFFIGAGEKETFEKLKTLGFNPIQQKSIGRYNIDIMVGSVAVELTCKSHAPHRDKHNLAKIKYLLKCGHGVVFVHATTPAVLLGCFNKFIPHLQSLCANPSTNGQYWMVRCHRERFTLCRNDCGQITAIPTPEKFFCVSKRFDIR